MEREELKSKLKWVLVVSSAIAGVVWILAAFGVVTGKGETNPLYLAIGMLFFVASGAWLLSVMSPNR
jgi:hypothetical protein